MKTIIILVISFLIFNFGGNNQASGLEPNLKVKISLNKNKFKSEEEVILNLEIKNIGKRQEEIIFETKSPSTLWATTARVIDSKTKRSVVKWQTSTISSTIYTENQLISYKYKINPEQIVTKKCKLTDIVVFNGPNFHLQKGKYELIIYYYNKNSNKVTFEIL